jgi:hypothetical protein
MQNEKMLAIISTFRFIPSYGDSRFHQGQQVVFGQTATKPRDEIEPSVRSLCSTCEVGQAPRSIPPLPLVAANGNPAGFHAFPPPVR